MAGMTTRTILRACIDLSDGKDVLIVAHSAQEAVRIARRVVAIAKGLGIPCRNVKGTTLDAPVVMARPYGYEVDDRVVNWRLRIHTDHSARGERPLTPPTRSVID